MARARLLELIAETSQLLELDEYRTGVLTALHRAVPADWIGLSDVGPDPQSIVELVDPPVPQELYDAFAELARENPLVRRYDETRDGRAYRFSDVVSLAELHELEIYRRVYGLIGLEHQIAFTLESGEDRRILAIHLGRRRRDFSNRERDLLNSARPFLIQAYRNAIRYTGALKARMDATPPSLDALARLGLTRRQAQALQLLASGMSEQEIAARLGISVRTAQKHLEHCYRRLGVNTRSAAAAIAWASGAPT
jgi:DNA-binding CsgD family transcriptional regulator